MHGIFRVFEETFSQYCLDRLDKDLRDAMNRQYSSYMVAPAFRSPWQLRKEHYNQKFQDYVDGLEPTHWGVR